MSTDTTEGGITSDVDRMAEFAATVPESDYGELWSLLDWSFWGAGMGDVLREPMATAMIAAIPADIRAIAETVMADFIERRKIEKTGVTIYQEQKDEVDRLREETERLTAMVDGLQDAGVAVEAERDRALNLAEAWAKRADSAAADVDRLREELTEMTGHRDAYIRDRDRWRAENARLRERLDAAELVCLGYCAMGARHGHSEREKATYELWRLWTELADLGVDESRERLPDERITELAQQRDARINAALARLAGLTGEVPDDDA